MAEPRELPSESETWHRPLSAREPAALHGLPVPATNLPLRRADLLAGATPMEAQALRIQHGARRCPYCEWVWSVEAERGMWACPPCDEQAREDGLFEHPMFGGCDCRRSLACPACGSLTDTHLFATEDDARDLAARDLTARELRLAYYSNLTVRAPPGFGLLGYLGGI